MTASKNLVVIAAASFLICFQAIAQQPPEAKPTPPPDTKKAPAAGAVIPPPAPSPVRSREQFEKEFQEALTEATLEGTWQMTGKDGLKGTAGLTEPKPDKYTIKSATKTSGDTWVIVAQIDFGDNDAFIPVPVRVVWAEDTAIITLNDLAVPLIGTYSARVMIHNGFYSGVWYCNAKNYGGVMQGRIVKTPAAEKAPEA